MNISKYLLMTILLSLSLRAQTIKAEIILDKIDANLVIDEAISSATMIIHARTGTRTIESKSWIKGKNKAFVEYLNPVRERGKKMLRLDDKIWNYIPEPTDRIITISGHLLKQSVMGSDLSYEDMTENNKMSEIYNAVISGEEVYNENECYILELTAKTEDVTYYSRKVWVEKSTFLPRKEERYAKSGKLLKRTEIQEIFKIDNRWYPKRMTFKDVLSNGKGTEYIIDEIKFGVDIPDYVFTKAALRK